MRDVASMSLRSIAAAMGGEVSGGQVLCPDMGHSPKDRGLAILLDANAPDGFVVHSHHDYDPIACKDYVRERCGADRFEPKCKRGNGQTKPARTTTTTKATPEEIKAANAAAKEALAAPDNETQQRRQVASYLYTNVDGATLYKVVRYEPKTFRPFRPDGKGGWIPGLGNIKRVPYRLTEMIASVDATILYGEGEKDTDRMRSLGLIATTLDGSAKWTPEIAGYFKDRDVIITPDFNATGVKRALAAAKALHDVAASIKMIFLPGLDGADNNKDVSDWLDQDPTREKTFEALCIDAPLWTPEAEVEGLAAAAEVKAKAEVKTDDSRTRQGLSLISDLLT